MPKRIDFFHEHPANIFGAFYPLGYVVLAFAERQVAERVRQQLLNDRFEEADGFASALGGETKIMEKHRDLAKSGATFLMVFAPDNALTERVANVVKAFTPLTADKYERLTIHGL
jgi:hypothetical protein